jgi:ribosome-binding factor A
VPSRQAETSRYARTARIDEVLRQVLAEEIERLADLDERFGLATVTSVDTAPDLRQATVFLSSLGEALAEALDEQRKHLQAAIGCQVRMKRTPQLRFSVDPAVEHGAKVDEIIRRWHGEGC